jgi:hypothetical protein
MPMSNRPWTPSPEARAMCPARLMRCRISRASTRKAAPADVSSTILLLRRSSSAPSSSSSALMAAPLKDWCRYRAPARPA